MPSALTCIIHLVYHAIANGLRRLNIDATTTTVAIRLELRMPEERSLAGISAAEHAARLGRAEAIARRLGFVGIVEYRHASSRSGGAHYGMAPTIEQDLILVYADAFRRDAAGDDFSLPAIIAHERGHQVLCRNERLRRNTPQEMSSATEEVLASLIGSLISDDPRDGEMLVLKALAELVDRGMPAADASRRVEDILNYLEAIL